jgi:hypothetical protein
MYLDPCIADEGPVLVLCVAPLIMDQELLVPVVYILEFVVQVPYVPVKLIGTPFVNVSSKVISS